MSYCLTFWMRNSTSAMQMQKSLGFAMRFLKKNQLQKSQRDEDTQKGQNLPDQN